ncbi:MAG: hypothetical protein ACXAE3_09490 [Candidatus Kariarchaeaceae archaeon]
MSDLTTEAKQSQSGSGKAIAIGFLSVLYTLVNDLTANIELFPSLGQDLVEIGIFVPASASIIFGRGIGGISGGLGEIVLQFEDILRGDGDLSSLHLGTLISSVSIGVGAWLTGFLGKENTKEESPDSYKGLLFSFGQWKKLGTDVIAAIVGLGVTQNFIYAYGSQFQEGASLSGGTAIFLQRFVGDSIALILILPLTLIGYDVVQVFLKKRDQIMEKLLLDIERTIEVEEGIKIMDVTLPKGVMVQGKWTPVKISFKNDLPESKAFHLDAVSTSRMYPDTDSTSILEPGAIWVQTFYILPSKQNDVNLRVRITPKTAESYQSHIHEQAVVEVNAKTKNPSSMTASLLGFGGVNFGVVGISATWDRVVASLGNPRALLDDVLAQWEVIWITIVAEILLFIPILTYMWRKSLKGGDEQALRIGFTRGFDLQNVQGRASGVFQRLKKRMQGKLRGLFLGLVAIASIAGVGYFGYEAYNLLTDPTYQLQSPELVFGLALGLLGTWLFGVRGGDLMKALGIGELSPWEFENDNTIISFKPLGQLQVDTPTEILVTAHNVTDQPGVRIVFQGFDSISPQVVELHIDPGKQTDFKIAVTPLKKEYQDILAISYPLFDQDRNYIDANVAEPFAEQEIQYEVQGQTSLGITKNQQDQLKKGLGASGFLAIAYTFAGQLISLPDFNQFLAENGVLFSALQAPFLYTYFYFSNKFKV